MNTHTFMFSGIYDISDLAEYIGSVIGVRLIARKSGDVVHGYLNQALKRNESYPDGFTVLTINYYQHEEKPNWNEETKEGHESHIKPYEATETDYHKLQEALVRLFNNDEDSVHQLSRDEIDNLLGSQS